MHLKEKVNPFLFLNSQERLEIAALTSQENPSGKDTGGLKYGTNLNGGSLEHGGNNKHRAHSIGRSK